MWCEGRWQAEEAKQRAIATPSDFVLKPQREGGGNNLYEEEMVAMLQAASDEQLQAYILMDIIRAPATPAVFMRNNKALETGAVKPEKHARSVRCQASACCCCGGCCGCGCCGCGCCCCC